MLPPAPYAPPADTGLDVRHADDALVVVDKPAGLLSAPGRGPDKQDCLLARLQRQFPDALIVHRLDMDTSGLLVFARGAEMHRRLSRQFRDRQVEKRYLAVVAGLVALESGEIDLPLICDWPNRPRQKVDAALGKASFTRYRRLGGDGPGGTCRLELTPVTGRSHQLRVHLEAIGHPIVGDPLYGTPASRAKASRLLLHASRLAFAHPAGGEWLAWESAAPF